MRLRLPPRLKRLIRELIAEEEGRRGRGTITKREGHTTYITDTDVDTPNLKVSNHIKVPEPWVWRGLEISKLVTPTAICRDITLHDVLAFRPPAKYEYDDGTGAGWVEGTVDDSIKNLFIGKRGKFTIPNGWAGVRFTWNDIPYVYFTTFYMYFTTRGNYMRVIAEASADGTTWTTIFDISNLISWPGHVVIKKHFRNADYRPYLRLTFLFTWENTNDAVFFAIRWYCSYFYNGEHFLRQLMDWDNAKNITLRGHLRPSSDNAYDLGSSSYRWRDIHIGRDAYIGNNLQVGGAILHGESIFRNGMKLVEAEKVGLKVKGIAILNPEGGLVAVITDKGDLLIRGEVRRLEEAD